MARSRALAAAAATFALTFPAAALADSAGDNQYSDPFGNTTPSAPAQTNTTTTPAATPAPATSTPATTTSSSSSTKTDPSAQLPRTGLDLRLVGGAGILLLGAGLLLRRRLARS
jgi:hypothetical protein